MTGVHSHAIASDAASSAEHARRHIAVRLLPFVFLLYITNYLDRTSVAYAAIGLLAVPRQCLRCYRQRSQLPSLCNRWKFQVSLRYHRFGKPHRT
jgi:hypothetical protein